MAFQTTTVPTDIFTPDPITVADHAACIVLDLRKTLDTVALDLALMVDAPEGESVDIAIENALLQRLVSYLGQPGLKVSDLTPELIQRALGASLTPE